MIKGYIWAMLLQRCKCYFFTFSEKIPNENALYRTIERCRDKQYGHLFSIPKSCAKTAQDMDKLKYSKRFRCLATQCSGYTSFMQFCTNSNLQTLHFIIRKSRADLISRRFGVHVPWDGWLTEGFYLSIEESFVRKRHSLETNIGRY